MKTWKKITALILATLLLLAMTGCGPAAPDVEPGTLEGEAGAKLTIMIPGHDASDETAWQNQVVEEYKKLYPDVTVEFVTASWENWQTKVLSAYKSGDPIDLINDGANNNPKFALKGITQPIDDYVNMENPNLYRNIMDEVFSYSGKHYVAVSETNVAVLYYNKNIFESEGVTDPGTLYANGEWNWENFVKIAKQLTDKSINRYGYASDYPYLFFGSNATSVLTLTEDAKYQLNIDDPALTQSLEIIQDGKFTSGWSGYDGSPYNTFYMGSAAMLGDWQFCERNILAAREFGLADFEYGVVPMPFGPNNTEGVSGITAAGWAIGSGSDCPAHVGKLIDMLVDGQAKYLAEMAEKLPAENQQLYAKLAEKPFCTNTKDSAVGGAYEICAEVAEGKSIAQVIEQYKPEYKRRVEEANSTDIIIE